MVYVYIKSKGDKKRASLAKIRVQQINNQEKKKGNAIATSLGMRESRLVSNVVPATTCFYFPTSKRYEQFQNSKEKEKKQKQASRDFPCSPLFTPRESRKIKDKKIGGKKKTQMMKNKVKLNGVSS